MDPTQRPTADTVQNVVPGALPMLPVTEPEALIDATDRLVAPPDTVHVWAFSLRGSSQSLSWCRNQLSQPELERAERFVHDTDRDAYTFAHGLMRHILGRYCDVPAPDLRFTTNSAGKPSLTLAGNTLHFNLTHASDRAILAVCDRREVGVDLERRRFDVEPLDIARYCFFGSELSAIERVAEQEQRDTFLRYWVAKEAVLKGEGVGLGFPLDRFQVQFATDTSEARIVSFDTEQLAGDWVIHMLPCDPGWFAAVAVKGDDWTVRYS